MLSRVVVRNDLGAFRVQPFIAVGVIEMPVRVDQQSEWFRAEIGKCSCNPGPGDPDAAVDQELAVGASQYRDISAGAFEHADVVPQFVCLHRRRCGAVLDQADQSSCFCKRLARREPARGGKAATNTAQAETSSAE